MKRCFKVIPMHVMNGGHTFLTFRCVFPTPHRRIERSTLLVYDFSFDSVWLRDMSISPVYTHSSYPIVVVFNVPNTKVTAV
jgi:hypothetical protein